MLNEKSCIHHAAFIVQYFVSCTLQFYRGVLQSLTL